MFQLFKPSSVPTATKALEGRDAPLQTADAHFVNGNPLKGPYPDGIEVIYFGMGCFWGAERLFWTLPGVYVTAVGYQAGPTQNPNYKEVCSGMTGHAETVLVAYSPAETSVERLLKAFEAAERTRDDIAAQLKAKGLGRITTEILDAPQFFFAEDYHQQYLAKNQGGYCGLRGTGVTCSV